MGGRNPSWSRKRKRGNSTNPATHRLVARRALSKKRRVLACPLASLRSGSKCSTPPESGKRRTRKSVLSRTPRCRPRQLSAPRLKLQLPARMPRTTVLRRLMRRALPRPLRRLLLAQRPQARRSTRHRLQPLWPPHRRRLHPIRHALQVPAHRCPRVRRSHRRVTRKATTVTGTAVAQAVRAPVVLVARVAQVATAVHGPVARAARAPATGLVRAQVEPARGVAITVAQVVRRHALATEMRRR
jgi:hypothetical protein